MATFDLLQLRTDLLSHLRNRTDATTTRLNHWTNVGYIDYAGRIRLDELTDVRTFASITSPTNTITYPDDVLAVLDLHDDTNDLPAFYIEYQNFRQLQDNPTTTGFIFSTNDRTIHVRPTPTVATVFSAMVQHAPATLVDNTDEPEIHDTYREGIVLLAARKAWDELGDSEQATLMEGRFDKWISRRQLTRLAERAANPRAWGLRVDFGYRNRKLGV